MMSSRRLIMSNIPVEVVEVPPPPPPEGVWRKPNPSTSSTTSSSTTSTTSLSSSEDMMDQHHPHIIPRSSSSSAGHHHQEELLVQLQEVVPMTIDTCEDLWTRLHDVRINGCVLEYQGRGKSIYDNGLAQSNAPLSPTSHYYEVKILDPGENCYIAVGLARQDYPSHKHPGWNRGSIAFHCDDGKIFIGSGIGTPFGPRCHANDVIGCGIVFPSPQQGQAKTIPPPPPSGGGGGGGLGVQWELSNNHLPQGSSSPGFMEEHNNLEASSESEDDIWWNNKNQVYEDKVQVFFMRNGKLLGIKEIRIPRGGFFPVIGLMSRNEKVMIDMNPLTG